MKRRSYNLRILIGGLLGIVIVLSGINNQPITTAETTTNSFDIQTSFSFTPHAPISISSDSDLEAFPGTGTDEDPYIIEGYNITTTSDEGIYVTGTTKYLVIQNCYVNAKGDGIRIYYIADGTLVISNNICSNNGRYGILVIGTPNATIVNNTCINNDNNGIVLSGSISSLIINNTCKNYRGGVDIVDSPLSIVSNNTCINDYIDVVGSDYSVITNNNFTTGGLSLYVDMLPSILTLTIEDNIVNGKSLGYFTNLDSVTIDEPIYGQLILVNCNDVSISNQQLFNTTRGLSLLNCSNIIAINNLLDFNGLGIHLFHTLNSIIKNNTCNFNGIGVEAENSIGSRIQDNTLCDNYHFGVQLIDSDNSTLSDNVCYRNRVGFVLKTFAKSCSNLTVINNICNSNSFGFNHLDYSNSVVANNTCNNNLYYGILIDATQDNLVKNNTCMNNDVGMYLGSTSSIVKENICKGNNVGISFSGDDSIHSYNLFQENVGYGLIIYGENNIIHHNAFVDNNLGGTSQACDNGTNSIWYDEATSEGNFWSDYSGVGPYLIDGSAGVYDLYPLNEPVIPPIISEFPNLVNLLFILLLFCLAIIPLTYSNASKK